MKEHFPSFSSVAGIAAASVGSADKLADKWSISVDTFNQDAI
jgi:hypothetical protein